MHIGLTLFIVFGIGGIIFFLRSDIRKKSDTIYQARTSLYVQAKMLSEHMALKEDAIKADPLLLKLKSTLPDKDGIYQAKISFEQMARRRNIAFNWRFGDETPPSGTTPGSVQLEIIAQGGYNEVVAFLQDIEGSRYFLNITGADITRQGTQANSVIQASMFFVE